MEIIVVIIAILPLIITTDGQGKFCTGISYFSRNTMGYTAIYLSESATCTWHNIFFGRSKL